MGSKHGSKAFDSPAGPADGLERAWRPKVAGLTNLLAATGDSLRLVIGFGSVIGRFGMPGESAYAIANDMLRSSLEQWAAAHAGGNSCQERDSSPPPGADPAGVCRGRCS